jgi:cysteinyl-tRNA synthetase
MGFLKNIFMLLPFVLDKMIMMKKIQLLLITAILCFPMLYSCSNTDEEDEPEVTMVYKQEMREFVQGISSWSKSIKPDFYVIPQNGVELVSSSGESSGNPQMDYLDAIDGIGQEDLFYGYENDNEATPSETTDYIKSFLNLAKGNGVKILVTDYCSDESKMMDSYSQNEGFGYTSFAANHRELDNIPAFPPEIPGLNSDSIISLIEVNNFLYLINPSAYSSKQAFVDAIKATDYDLLIMDYFFNDEVFTSDEVEQLHQKSNGGRRLLISYMSIGEAEDYRYYWQAEWSSNPPSWLAGVNPDWPGNFKVKYWEPEWQQIIFGNNDSYLKKIIDSGFDGVYLDIIDAFEYFEE